ncbi:helix-turn-helix domain-containing protein, partial [Patescibacteria group bacterium]
MQARFETRKIVRTQSLGEILREARLERGFRIDEMAEKTMIQDRCIENLEKSRYDDLPAKVYVEGYLRRIATMLQLDPDRVVKLYRKEIGIQENLSSTHTPEKKRRDTRKKTKLIISPAIIRNIAIVAAILAGIGYLWYQVSSLSEPPELHLIQPTGDQEIASDELTVLGTVDETAELRINGQSVFVNETGEFKETLSLQEGANT